MEISNRRMNPGLLIVGFSIMILLLAVAPSALTSKSGGVPPFFYEAEPTHYKLTGRAVDLATANSGYTEIGFYKTTIQGAAIDEDKPARFVHHFWNPTDQGLGLPRNSYTEMLVEESAVTGGVAAQYGPGLRYMSALDWGRDGMPDHKDWRSAIEAYDYTDRARERAYDALGHVLHLVQDMGQPDHASDRPHPGNKISFAGLVGYETLWAMKSNGPGQPPDWPAGKSVVVPSSLEDAFKSLAIASQKAEGDNHVPRNSKLFREYALGLGPLFVGSLLAPIRSTNDDLTIVLGFTIYAPNPQIKYLANEGTNYSTYRDNVWNKFELNMPAIPTIPYPDNQTDLTRDYINLGNTMLPMIEEHGAGLLQYFYDIVNPPPYVASVEIYQNHTLKYKKYWDQPDGVDHLTSRQLKTEASGALEANVEAELRIQFGPSQPIPHANAGTFRKAVGDVRVWVEAPRGSNHDAGPGKDAEKILGGFSENPGSPFDFTWTARFTPSRAGTLRIEARDQDNHVDNRNAKGDLLDSNPSTPARAGSKPPYDLSGYEPGADENHTFTLGGECTDEAVAPGKTPKVRAGTYTGTIKTTIGDESSENFEETKITVTFRALLNGRSWDLETYAGGSFEFGHAKGEFKSRWKVSDYPRPNKMVSAYGAVGIYGDMEMIPSSKVGHQHPYGFNIVFRRDDVPTPDTRDKGLPVGSDRQITGIACKDGDLLGLNKPQPGYVVTKEWNLVFDAMEVPYHVAMSDELSNGVLSNNIFENYIKQMTAALTPGLSVLFQQKKDQKIGAYKEIYAEMNTDTGLFSAISDSANKIKDLYEACSKIWLSEEPNAENEGPYKAKSAELQTAIADWKVKKRTLEERYAMRTEKLAALIQAEAPDGAKKLLSLASKLKQQGAESFGSSAVR